MPDNTTPGTPSVTEIQARLHEVAGLLRDTRSMDPQSRQVLAELVRESRRPG
jgi:hypothetical protein